MQGSLADASEAPAVGDFPFVPSPRPTGGSPGTGLLALLRGRGRTSEIAVSAAVAKPCRLKRSMQHKCSAGVLDRRSGVGVH
jgi:hypothetical protein